MFRHRDYYELQLTFMWEDALGTRDLNIRDDFFEIGGQAAAAEDLLAKVKRDFGAEVSVEQFAAAATIEELAAAVRQASAANGPRLTPCLMQGSAPPVVPIIFVHDVAGDVKYLQRIRGADIGRPIIGIRPVGVDLDGEPLTTFEDMATRYVTDLDAMGAREPFVLGGFSAGGLIAYEMALRLEQSGRTVAYLGLFEPPYMDGTTPEENLAEIVFRHAQDLCILHEIEFIPDRLDDCIEALKDADEIPRYYSPELVSRTLELFAINHHAMDLYQVSDRFNGTAVLYESRTAEGGPAATGTLTESEVTGNCYETLWSRHLAPQTVVRRQNCDHRVLHHTRETKKFLTKDVKVALAKFGVA